MDDQIASTMDAATESNQESAPASEEAAVSDEVTVSSSSDEASVDATKSGPANPVSDAPPEDSGEPETKKAEDAADLRWKDALLNFHDKLNGVLAAKENMKLVAVEQKVHPAYVLNWKIQSNRHFQLVVAMRRRLKNGKVGGKTVA